MRTVQEWDTAVVGVPAETTRGAWFRGRTNLSDDFLNRSGQTGSPEVRLTACVNG